MFRKALLLLILSISGLSLAMSQELNGETKVLASQNLQYRVDKPDGYEQNGPSVPLLLFLHGGDRSNTKHHPKKYAQKANLNFPFMVVAPQRSTGSWGSVDFDALLSEVLQDYNVDRNRIYITGYSFGGYGTWSAITQYPDWFAAAAPIAGGGNERKICQAKDVAIRAYHGTSDRVTPYSGSKKLIETLKGCKATAELISMEGEDHWIWPKVFSDQSFYDWLLKHSKDH